MKKYLFLLLSILLFNVRAVADDVTLSKCGGDTSQQGLGISGYSSISAACNFYSEDLTPYVGGTITHLRCYIATTTNMKTLKLWVKNKANDLQTLSSVTVSSPVVGWNEVALTKPVEITGEDNLCIGYTFTQTSTKPCYALTFSGFSSEGGCVIGRGTSYSDMSEQYGNVAIEGTVSGVSVEGKRAEVCKVKVDKAYYSASQEGCATITYINNGSDLSSITLRLNCGEQTIDETVTGLLPFGGMGEITIGFTTPATADGDTPLSVSVVAIDGEPYEGTPMAVTFPVYTKLYDRNVVIEEGTGTWCQWCVRGIVAMDYMYDRYPDTFIGIAVHSGDAMAISGYVNYLGLDGFPGCTVDRTKDLTNQLVEASYFESYYNQERSRGTYADFSLQATLTDGVITARSEATFDFAKQNADLRMVYVLTENGVTGYSQQNAYAGGSSGEMGGFENLPSVISDQVFNDVARAISPSFYGQENSLCGTIVPGEKYVNELTLSVPTKVQNDKNLSLTALMVEGNSGEIVQAHRVSLSGEDGVDSVMPDSKINACVDGGEIVVTGLHTGENVSVWDAAGRHLSSAVSAGSACVRIPVTAKGMVVVRTSEGRSLKILVGTL